MAGGMKTDWDKAIDTLAASNLMQGRNAYENKTRAERHLNDALGYQTRYLGRSEAVAKKEIASAYTQSSDLRAVMARFPTAAL